ncbi:hypothetical protein PCANC_26096 [Puccinia coronata f. sp. avenae]|uniref:UBA domain-containing protein n=1 Tax=Puccinia coronata f. sp. avenae TaxID=200324 RepID=A0A2N5RYP0_9BASI|nr:hypothetical protein PCANC_26096 [Puccinia coronata f. sp. avenae]
MPVHHPQTSKLAAPPSRTTPFVPFAPPPQTPSATPFKCPCRKRPRFRQQSPSCPRRQATRPQALPADLRAASQCNSNHSSHDSCQATPNQASCSNNNNMSLQTPFSASPIYPQSLFHHSPGSVSSATSPARVRTPPWKMIPTTIKLFPNHPRQAGQYLSHISTNLGQTPVTSQPRHCANGNTNFTNHSHDGSSEQSHQSPHLVSQHPLSKSRLPLAYPPTNSPTFPSNSSPAYDSVMNSCTARPNSTFCSSVRTNGGRFGQHQPDSTGTRKNDCLLSGQPASTNGHRPIHVPASQRLRPGRVPLQSLYLLLDSCRYSTSQFHQPPTSRPPTRASRSNIGLAPPISLARRHSPIIHESSNDLRRPIAREVNVAEVDACNQVVRQSETVTFLGALQPVVSWKHILIKAYAPTPWSDGSTPASRFASAAVPIPTSSSGAVSIPVLPAIVDQTQIRSVATIRTNALSTSEAVSMTTTARPNSTAGKTSQPAAASPASESSMDNVKALRSIASSIYQSLNPFFSAIIKLFSSRRVTDEALKKQALYTAGLLAQVLSGHLVWPDADNPSSNFAYLTVCLNTASQLLTDERGNRTTLNSLILSPFFDSGGLSVVLGLIKILDEGQLASLVDMGFPRSACETALARTHNNLNLAAEFQLASPVLVQHA